MVKPFGILDRCERPLLNLYVSVNTLITGPPSDVRNDGYGTPTFRGILLIIMFPKLNLLTK